MNLTEKPDFIQWPVTHYVFVEKIGPFQETAQKAWTELHQVVSEVGAQVKLTNFFSLYQMKPQMIYRAGVGVETKPDRLPNGLQYVKFEGGKYARFVLTGSYANLPSACGRVFEIVEKTKIPVRSGAFYIENYVNDPKTTPEAQLVTEILIPTT